MPYDLRTAIPVEPGDEDWQEGYLLAHFEVTNGCETAEVTPDQYRIIQQYQAAHDRACDADFKVEKRRKQPPDREPEPEEIPPARQLMPRQDAFCRHYAAQPVAARAAALAGYEELNAANPGYRLLKNPLVLDRIARLRAEQNLHYVVEPDTIHDKLEAVFFEALAERNHAAAVAALRLQAGLARLPTRLAAPRPDDEGEREKPRKAEFAAEKSREKPIPMTRKADE